MLTTDNILLCRLKMTDRAREQIAHLDENEVSLFSSQSSYAVYIERRSNNNRGNMSFYIFFDDVKNRLLTKKLEGKVAVLECVYENDGLLAIGFQVRVKKETLKTNRRLAVTFRFELKGTGKPLPINFYTELRELPIAEERSEYVKKRIESWEGYLRIQEKNANVDDIITSFVPSTFAEKETKLLIKCKKLTKKEWNKIEGLSVSFIGYTYDVGQVVNVYKNEQLIEIALSRNVMRQRERYQFDPFNFKEVLFSNGATLSQIRRLRKGFYDLEKGFAANRNLERILFEERPAVMISKEKKDLQYHNDLNEYQREAVHGALTAHDLYVIQGPPGTGKTTVISEICHQNVKAGLKTLIASQSNLAVDNALGRLLFDPEIRILRYGRTESIEEEGKRFIEENVALLWRDETIVEIQKMLNSYDEKLKEYERKIRKNKEEYDIVQEQLVILKEEQVFQEQLQDELKKIRKERQLLQEQLDTLKQQCTIEEKNKVKYKQQLEYANESIMNINAEKENVALSLEEALAFKELRKMINPLKKVIQYKRAEVAYKTLTQSLANIKHHLSQEDEMIRKENEQVNKLMSIAKINSLHKWFHESGLEKNETLQHQLRVVTLNLAKLKDNRFIEKYNGWKALEKRFVRAIQVVEKLLLKTNYPIHKIQPINNTKYTTITEMNEMLNMLRDYITSSFVGNQLADREASLLRRSVLNKISDMLAVTYAKKEEVSAICSRNYIILEESKKSFEQLKEKIMKQLQKTISNREQARVTTKRQLAELQERVNKAEAYFAQIDLEAYKEYSHMETNQLQAILEENEQQSFTYAAREAQWNKYVLQYKLGKEECQNFEKIIEDTERLMNELEREIQPAQRRYEEITMDLTKLQQRVNEKNIDECTEYEEKEIRVAKLLRQYNVKRERLAPEKEIQIMWLDMLRTAPEYDLDEIRKIYVDNANVIGTTCVASASKKFMEEYPTFDVVIIDEVSKATPPELLLPMLKGKKVILVGDHHQLPPLIGRETLDELVEETQSVEEKKTLQTLLQESLFERLFNNLPKENKTMLGIQYRMHEKIMQTITPFYEEENYQLQCGLTNSDEMRNHLLETSSYSQKNHVVWFDMPNEKPYFEQQRQGSTSRYNESELAKIKELLIEMEEATERIKLAGIISPAVNKNIGIISFYGEQVKRIDQLIDYLKPEHLTIRTGSVDKFQGMEMDIIIVSFVRNHNQPNEDIGFAKDYRRLNVALSRAKELLIIIGSSKMFTKSEKDIKTAQMYKRLLKIVEQQNGVREYRGVT